MRRVLNKIRHNLGQPETLLLKDPLLTSKFDMVSKLLPEADFIVSTRHPIATVASRLMVSKKSGSLTENIPSEIVSACDEYNSSYAGILRVRESLGLRLSLIKYENIIKKDFSEIPAIFRDSLNLDKLWNSNLTDIHKVDSGPWGSILYGQPIAPQSNNLDDSLIADNLINTISTLCGETAERLGYEINQS